MKLISQTLLVLCFSGVCTILKAQQDQVPELLPAINSLSAEQKSQVLDYAHHLGAYFGKPVEKTCQLLDVKNQNRVLQYIQYLKNPNPPLSTTVHWNFDTLTFAAIEEGIILIDSFIVTNTGSAPYVIREAKTSCDCAVLRYPKFPVLPGDSDVVRVEFDSVNKAGQAVPGIVLYDNSRPNRRSILYLKGDVIPRGKIKVIKNR